MENFPSNCCVKRELKIGCSTAIGVSKHCTFCIMDQQLNEYSKRKLE